MDALRDEWSERLSEELWSSESDHTGYAATADSLLAEYAALGLRVNAKSRISAHIDGTIKKLLPTFAPLSARVATFADTATSAFLLSCAESWAELDGDEVVRLAGLGWERARRDDPASNRDRFRAGVTLVGLTSFHPTQPDEKRLAGYEALGEYVTGQPAYVRLLALEAHFCTSDMMCFFDLAPEDEEQYRWNNARSWHLGVSTWVLDRSGWLQ